MNTNGSKPNTIACHDFSVYYPQKKALNSLSLTFHEKETYAILGPSGCGKTTLLYALAGLLPTSSRVEGTCKSLPMENINTVLQDFGLFPWKTVLENTMLPLLLKGAETTVVKNQAVKMLKDLGLVDHQDHYPSALSGGQKQRVAIARAWLSASQLLLLDEPFSALDALTRESLQEELLKYYQDSPLTIIVVTHSIEEAVFLGKHIIVFNQDGSLKTQFENTSFGIPEPREHSLYYEQCLNIRKLIKGVSA